MAIGRAQANSGHPANGLTGAVAYTSSVTAGSLLIAAVSCNAATQRTTTAVSDNVNGSWAKADAALFVNAGFSGEISVWYFANAASGATTVTASYGGNVATNCLALAEYTGMPTTAVIDITSTLANDAGGTTHTTTSATTTVADLLIGAFGDQGDSATYSAAGSWTKATAFDASGSCEVLLEDQGVGGTGIVAGSYVANCTTSSSTVPGDVFVAFKATASGTNGAVSGTTTSSATVTAVRVGSAAVTGTTTSTATVTATKTDVATVSGTTTSTATVTANALSAAVSGTTTSVSTVTASRSDAASLTGTTTSTGTVTATKTDVATVSGTTTSTAVVTASTAPATVSGTTTSSGTVTAARSDSATIASTTTSSATITAGRSDTATVSGTTVSSATITAAGPSGNVAGTTISAGTITASRSDSGAITGIVVSAAIVTATKTDVAIVSGTTVSSATVTANAPGIVAATVTATTTSTSTVTAAITGGPVAQGSWWSLLDIIREAQAFKQDDETGVPLSCPNDGEILTTNSIGRSRCTFDGWEPHG